MKLPANAGATGSLTASGAGGATDRRLLNFSGKAACAAIAGSGVTMIGEGSLPAKCLKAGSPPPAASGFRNFCWQMTRIPKSCRGYRQRVYGSFVNCLGVFFRRCFISFFFYVDDKEHGLKYKGIVYAVICVMWPLALLTGDLCYFFGWRLEKLIDACAAQKMAEMIKREKRELEIEAIEKSLDKELGEVRRETEWRRIKW